MSARLSPRHLLQRLLLLALLPALATAALPAQERDLHWRAIDVDARLDRDGVLHVRERQVMVFTGDWNGGERRFDVRVGQHFELERLARIDSVDGRAVPLREGDLAEVDNYGWGENRTLRWRSRLPTDPPFAGTALTYEIDYTLGNILVPAGDGYVLDHDFAFADRSGAIDSFTVRLSLDDAWQAAPGFTGVFRTASLPPGEGYVVNVPLRYVLAGRPAGVEVGAAPVVRFAIAGALVVALLALFARFVARERSSGRFVPLVPPESIDEAWLRAQLFSMLPEEAGALWDDSTSAPEVAAVLARLVGEKKLASEVKSKGKGIFAQHVLHLRLLVDRDQLRGYERALVDALFQKGANSTSTDDVRARYKKTGFDPAAQIREALKLRAANLPGGKGVQAKPSRRPTLLLLAAAVALLVLAGVRRETDALVAAVGAGVALATYLIAASQAAFWQSRVRNAAPHMLRFVVPVALGVAWLLLVMAEGRHRAGALVLAGLALLAIAVWNSVLNIATARQSPERLALRRRLAAAREYFRRELKQPAPALRDEWYPYFLAFGLGGEVDRWFKAFGGESAAVVSASRGASLGMAGGGSSRSGGPEFSGFGGGGGFSGGGSSGSWSAAVSSFAAGVSAPSSSSSGGSSGGGGGGGSSGGGGGGGW